MTPIKNPSILLTGTTGGLGSRILHHLLHTHKLPPSTITATSRNGSSRVKFISQNLNFRVLDYASSTPTLVEALTGVGTLLFIASSQTDPAKRNAEHANVIDAAVRAGVERLWYVSLAFGGFRSESAVGFQRSHYFTEEYLARSGLEFLSLRAGIYADAFPLFLNWYPASPSSSSSTTKKLILPTLTPPLTESKVAWTSRDDLAEGIAALLANGLEAYPSIQPKTDRRIILLTGTETASVVDLVGAIDAGLGKNSKTEVE